MGETNKKMLEKSINIILNVLIVIFSIILFISIYNNLQVKVFKKDYSDFFGYSVFEVQTGSMKPEINPGDWIIVKSSNDIKLRDIITYKKGGEYITHRVIGTYNSTYVTKGDANNSKDEPIDAKQVVGKVVKILPTFGILKKTIFNPFVLVSLIITILICNFVFKNKKIDKSTITKMSGKCILIKDKISKTVTKLKQQNNVKKVIKKNFSNEKEIDTLEETIDPIDPIDLEDSLSYIPVDVSELDNTFLEIANNEIEEEPTIVKKEEVIEEIIEEEKPTKLNLELLEKNRKSKNIIDKFVSIKIEEINEIINIFVDDRKLQVNEPTIKNTFMSHYIEAKYYNFYGTEDYSNHKKQSLKIEKYLLEVANKLKNKYKGSDIKYSEKVDKYLNIFNIISNLEQANKSISDKRVKEEYYKKEITKYTKIHNWDTNKIKISISNILKIQRNYIGIVEYLLKKLETNMFELHFNKVKTKKNMFGISLEHNITFGKVYSDYIIEKTYNEGVIAENKILILLNLLSIRIVRDMIESNFDKEYIVYIPKSLYSKVKKLEKILRIIDDSQAKDSIKILVEFSNLNAYKAIIKKLKKDGYNFVVSIGVNTNIDQKSYPYINLVEHVFVDKNIPNVVKTLSTLPAEVMDKIIYDDIVEKIGDFGGE